MTDPEEDDGLIGELLPTERFSSWSSEIAPGDLVHFRYTHPYGPEFLGFVRAVLGGHEMVYDIEVAKDTEVALRFFVRRGAILRAWIPQ